MGQDWISWALDGALLTVCIALSAVIAKVLIWLLWS